MATYTKNVRQYSRKLPSDTMEFLRWLVGAYAKVKKATYERYSGIGSLGKLTPGYTVLNEMRASGMRQEMGMPVMVQYIAEHEEYKETAAEGKKNSPPMERGH